MVAAERSAFRSDGYRQMRAIICHTFPKYDFDAVNEMCADELVELVGAAEWVLDQQSRPATGPGRRRRRR